MMNCKRILVPVDFSAKAELALEWAVRLAKEEQSPMIYLLHVLPYIADPTYLIGWTDDCAGFRWDQAEHDLMQWQEKIPRSIPSIALLRKGKISETIATICKEKAIDLVVMTNHERRIISRVIRPSTSEETTRLACCPVLVLHLNQQTANLVMQSR